MLITLLSLRGSHSSIPPGSFAAVLQYHHMSTQDICCDAKARPACSSHPVHRPVKVCISDKKHESQHFCAPMWKQCATRGWLDISFPGMEEENCVLQAHAVLNCCP